MLRDDWPKSLRRDHRPVRRPRVHRRRPVRRRPVLRWRGDVQSGPVPTDEHITVRRRPNLRRRKRPMRRPRLVVIWRLRLHHRRPGKCRYVVVAGLVCRAVSGLPASSFQRHVIRGFSSFHGQFGAAARGIPLEVKSAYHQRSCKLSTSEISTSSSPACAAWTAA